MSNQETTQATVVSQAAIRSGLGLEQIALFNPDGTPFSDSTPAPAVHVAQVTTANASDPTTTQALANANKVAINALITSLQNAGYLSAT